MTILNIKALHIIFVVTWFAGLFYIVRLFIYHVEACQKQETEKNILTEQFKIMEKRLWYGITWPSAVLAVLFGTILLIHTPDFLEMPWMRVKLIIVTLLVGYHFLCGKILEKLKTNTVNFTSNQLRIWNEMATIFLVSIVFLVELQNTFNWVYALLGLLVFSGLLMIAICIYRKIRNSR